MRGESPKPAGGARKKAGRHENQPEGYTAATQLTAQGFRPCLKPGLIKIARPVRGNGISAVHGHKVATPEQIANLKGASTAQRPPETQRFRPFAPQ